MRYTLLGRHSGLRVSELVMGAGLFGTKWGYGAEPAEARSMLDGYLDAGGNFIDTSDTYQLGQSEELLGEFLHGKREDVVLATKFTNGARATGGLLTTGNSRKNMVASLEQSLRRLKTDRIDLYWVHMPDAVTPIDEIMRGLDDLVRSGKILYIGLSDFPAWRTAGAATLAELRGTAPVVAQQIEYSLVQRTPDSDLLPMAAAHGLATLAWSPLGGGVLTGKYRKGETGRETNFGRLFHSEDTAQKTAIIDGLEAVAGEIGSNPGRVAIAWVRARGALPIIGPRNRSQLDDNLGAADLVLSDDQMARLNAVSAVPLGFPHDMLADNSLRNRLAGGKLDLLDQPSQPVR